MTVDGAKLPRHQTLHARAIDDPDPGRGRGGARVRRTKADAYDLKRNGPRTDPRPKAIAQGAIGREIVKQKPDSSAIDAAKCVIASLESRIQTLEGEHTEKSREVARLIRNIETRKDDL